MTELELKIKTIQEKLQQLLKQHLLLQKENSRLKEELAKATEQEEKHLENINALKQQVDVLKLGAGEMNEKDKKEFEKKINAYIKEIDRAITHLGG